METKINVAEILKDKPQGTKLYDLLRNIDVYLDEVHITDIESYIECTANNEVGSTILFDYSKLGTEVSWLDGLQILIPSREMHDWSKFAWKKGDLLVNSCGFQCIFKEWASDDYTKFNGCYSNSRDGYEDVSNAETAKFDKLDHNIAYGYVREIERKLGGKLNLETLEIEKSQPEFKDGDIVRCINGTIVLIKEISFSQKVYFHAYIFLNKLFFQDNSSAYYGHAKDIERIATEEEKQQLFSALSKENKAWDAEKKQIVDLKPKWTPKPFDRVITRNAADDIWTANIFSHMDSHGEYVTIACVGGYTYCLPYNEDTAKLIGTTKDVEG